MKMMESINNPLNLRELFKEHYKEIVRRGLIKENTFVFQFLEKLDEEVKELKEAYDSEITENFIQESIDCICVLVNMLQHFDVNIKEALIRNINYQKTRNL